MRHSNQEKPSLLIWLRRVRARRAAPAAHSFAEFLTLLGRHPFPALHHLASPAEPAAPWTESSEEQPRQDHQSHGLPKRNCPKPEESRHQIIPQMRDRETKGCEDND